MATHLTHPVQQRFPSAILRTGKPRRQGLARIAVLGMVAGLAVCLFAGIFTWVVSKPSFTVTHEMDVAMRQAIKGELDLAYAIVQKHELSELEEDVDRAKKELVEGIYEWAQSQKMLDHQASIAKAEEAYKHLKAANEYGFPRGYEGLGNFALGMVGKTLRQGDEPLKHLEIASVRYPQERSKSIAAMIDIMLDRLPPDVQEAQKILDHWKSLPTLNQSDLDTIEVAKSRILLAQHKVDEAVANAQKVGQDSVAYVAARLLQANTYRAQAWENPEADKEALLNKALEISQELSASPIATPAQRRESLYLTGKILRDLGKLTEALSHLSKIRHQFPETPESLASGIEEMEIAIELGYPDQSIDIAKYFNQHLGKPDLYISDRFVPEEFRRRFVAVGKQLVENGYYEIATAYSHVLPAICSESDRLRIEADSQRKIGERVIDEEAATGKGIKQGLTGKDTIAARPFFRNAGKLYSRLAMLELRSPDHSELLWQGIECFRAAHELERANEMLDLYMNLESRAKKPRAILAKGENLLASGQADQAMASFRFLLENYRDNPLAYKARILSAQALGEQLKFDEASEMLLDNLYDGKLSPENPMWRDSLFHIGALLYRRGEILHQEAQRLTEIKTDASQRVKQLELSFDEYQNSIRRLEEALQRFGNDERSFQTQYMLAEAYRRSAKLPQTILNENLATTDEKRQQRVGQHRDLLLASQQAFSQLRKRINARNDALELNPAIQAMLRNCYFGEADILFELKDYSEALVAYRNTANRYRFEPEALEALLRVSSCHEKLGNTREAKQALIQAQQILKGIPSDRDSRFREVTPFDRKQWDQHLNWLASSKS